MKTSRPSLPVGLMSWAWMAREQAAWSDAGVVSDAP